MTTAPGGTRRCRGAIRCVVSLSVTVGMSEYQMRRALILVVAIPVRPVRGLLALHHRPPDGTLAVLLPKDSRTKRRGYLLCQLPFTVLKIRLPCARERVGIPRDLAVALRCACVPNPPEVCAGDRVGKSPRLSRLMGNVPVRKPAAGCVRLAQCGPAAEASPDNAIALGDGCAPDAVALIMRPAPSEGGRLSMRASGVAPAAGLHRVVPVLVMACTLAVRGVMWRLAGLPLARACLRKVCPRQATPGEMGGRMGFSVDSRPPRLAKTAVIRGRTTSANPSRALAVTMKSSAPLP
jgi:hypothetical protein